MKLDLNTDIDDILYYLLEDLLTGFHQNTYKIIGERIHVEVSENIYMKVQQRGNIFFAEFKQHYMFKKLNLQALLVTNRIGIEMRKNGTHTISTVLSMSDDKQYNIDSAFTPGTLTKKIDSLRKNIESKFNALKQNGNVISTHNIEETVTITV